MRAIFMRIGCLMECASQFFILARQTLLSLASLLLLFLSPSAFAENSESFTLSLDHTLTFIE